MHTVGLFCYDVADADPCGALLRHPRVCAQPRPGAEPHSGTGSQTLRLHRKNLI
jgi:hypothetical protein